MYYRCGRNATKKKKKKKSKKKKKKTKTTKKKKEEEEDEEEQEEEDEEEEEDKEERRRRSRRRKWTLRSALIGDVPYLPIVHSGRVVCCAFRKVVRCTSRKCCTLYTVEVLYVEYPRGTFRKGLYVVRSERDVRCAFRKGCTLYIQEGLYTVHSGRALRCTSRKGCTLYIQEGLYVVHSGRDVRCTFRKGCALFIQERMGCSVGRADGREGSGEDGRTVRHLHLAEQPAVYRRVPPRRCHLPGESSASLPSR